MPRQSVSWWRSPDVFAAPACAVPVDNVVQYVRAIEAVGIDRRDPVYWAGRTVLIHRHEDVDTYDRSLRLVLVG